jgi:hypothetical protein
MYKSKSVLHSNSGSNRSSSNNENKSNRYSVASALIDEEEYNSGKLKFNLIKTTYLRIFT